MTVLLLALTLTASQVLTSATLAPAADAVPRDPERGAWPAYIRVHLIHKRGSSQPARVIRVPFEEYLGTVAASGAWPAHLPIESIKAGIVILATRATWLVRHPQPGYVWRGRRYDIHSGSPRKALRGRADAGQLYRPGTYVHSKIRRAVRAVRGTLLYRPNGSLRKPRWSGNGRWCGHLRTGNALPEGGATACARRGWGYRRILSLYFPRDTVPR